MFPLPRADLAAWHVDGAVSERAGELEGVSKGTFLFELKKLRVFAMYVTCPFGGGVETSPPIGLRT